MANKRVLDLAKELNVEVSDIQRAARKCSVAVSGPTTMLTDEDTSKIKSTLKDSSNEPASGKTLTLNRPIVTGQARTGSVEGRGRTVQVAVRRRRVVKTGEQVSGQQPTSTESPAEKAAKAVPPTKPETVAPEPKAAPKVAEKPAVKSAEQKPAEKPAEQKPATTVRRKQILSPAERASRAVEQKKEAEQAARQKMAANKPQQGPGPRREGERPGPGGRPQRPARGGQQGGPGQQQGKSSGPRTTIRRGLTPAQIAAAKAPRSTVKEIEQKISEERAERRRESQGGRGGPRTGGPGAGGPGAGAPRRTPSVAVAPDADATAPTGAPKRRGPGGPGGRPQQRRLTPAEKAARRAYSEKRHVALTDEQVERMSRLASGKKRKSQRITKDDAEFVVREVEITDPILVSELASRMAIKGAEVVKELFQMGMPATVNEAIDAETAVLIVEEFGHKPKVINEAAVEDVLKIEIDENEEDLKPRPPVVVVMGHVDHGKTSILDALRKARVADGEAGGITQHIGAYMVKLDSNERVVFIDTPGHEAFTGLRSRGAKLTDVAVLVVAADDGVKPQTVEALNHAKAAGVPIIVAVNKMDKEGADPEMVKRQLSEHELISEDWGGDTIFVNVSARTGQGLPELLEMLALQTEILELKANPDRRGQGIVIESRLDRGRGPVATVLVQNGTFKQGDIVVVGSVMGRVRAIVDENSVQHRTAGPSIPFELLGLEDVPEAGQEVSVVENERQARDIVTYRKDKEREEGANLQKRASLDELFASMQSGMAEVPVLIKGDVTGSVEAMADSLAKAGTDEVQVKVVHKAIGGITESDVMLASASNAIIIGFNVRPEAKAKRLAEAEGVDVRFYKVIYDAIDDIKAAMAGQLSPEKVEKEIGLAEVRDVFQVPKVGAVAGCYVTDGYVTRNARVRVLREGVLVYDGELASLKRFKDDVKEVRTGYECGIGVEKFNDVKVGDNFEFYIVEEIQATL